MAKDGNAARYGATPEAWAHWQKLGLTADLLPYVANPGAVIAPYSTMKKLGKTPAFYDRNRQVHGFVKWQDHITTAQDVGRWSPEGDYGVCLQGRRIRAWDIDVPDPAQSKAIADAITSIGGVLPVRSRADSGKVLLAFEVAGDWFKDVLEVDGGKIEFLAQGQQFLVTGRHEDGARYVWDGPEGLPTGFPVWTAETVQAVKDLLGVVFDSGQGWSLDGGGGRARSRGEDLDVEDEVATWLVENWETFGAQGEKLFVLCPWKDAHSIDSGETEASWLLRGTRGYERGHFKCLHAGCASRGRDEFLQAVGYDLAGFEVMGGSLKPGQDAAEGTAAGALGRSELSLPLPGFKRNRNGIIYATIGNVIKACLYAEVIGWHIRYDNFLDDLMIARPGVMEWRPIDDADPIDMRADLEDKSFEPVGPQMMKDALISVAKRQQFDSAISWLTGLTPWDGVKRCERFFIDYMPGANDDYGRALGRYVWSAHAGRIMSPGCQVDITPLLVGSQGLGKTRGVSAIAPFEGSFCEIGFHDKDDDRSRKMRGALVCEIPELRGLNTTDAQSIKAFMTKKVESWIPKYREKKTTFGRRLMFYGTSNEDEILADATGERRWAPRRVTDTVRVALIERDRDQLWVEGLVLYAADGVHWQDAERLAAPEHDAYRVVDLWEDKIAAALSRPDDGFRNEDSLVENTLTLRQRGCFRTDYIATGVLGKELGSLKKPEADRISRILRVLGMENITKWVDGRAQRVWIDKKS